MFSLLKIVFHANYYSENELEKRASGATNNLNCAFSLYNSVFRLTLVVLNADTNRLSALSTKI